MKNLQAWYSAQSRREQMLVLVTAILLIVFIVYFLIWQPLNKSIANMDNRLQRQQTDLTWMRVNSARVRAAAGNNTAVDRGERSLIQVVTASSSRHGLSLSRVQESGSSEIRLWLDSAGFDAMLRWLDELEAREGIAVQNLSVNQTDTTGMVKATVTLVAPN